MTVPENEVLTVEAEKDNLTLIKGGLEIAAKKNLSGRDLGKIALKVGRDVLTVKKYLRGDVRDESMGQLILNYCNGFIAINNDADDRKSKLQY